MAADPSARVFEWLDRQDIAGSSIALGYSGGGDSQALLLVLLEWAARRNTRVHALTVDHGLRPESAAEAEHAAAFARLHGATAAILRWHGDKPERGVQAAARRARHELLADYCRREGITHLALGHTLDDQAETLWMRLKAGGDWRAIAGMRAAGPSPAWPLGRGLTLLRPFLGLRRAQLRGLLEDRSVGWVEDPSNADSKYTRVLVRQQLDALEKAGFQPGRLGGIADDVQHLRTFEDARVSALARNALSFEPWGGARLDSAVLDSAGRLLVERLLGAVALTVSGRSDFLPGKAVAGLCKALCERKNFTAGGVQLLCSSGETWVIRDRGAVIGRVDRVGLPEEAVPAGRPIFWDGRYEIETPLTDICAGPLGTRYPGLDNRAVLKSVPGAARSSLLALRQSGTVIAIPGVLAHADVKIRPLFSERFASRLLPGASKSWFHGDAGAENRAANRTDCATDSHLDA